MPTVTVRYIVDDVEAAISFYENHLDFKVEMHPGPGFAMLARGDLRLALNAVAGTGWMEPHPAPHRGHRVHGRLPARGRRLLPQRHRQRHGRQASPRRRPLRQLRRALRSKALGESRLSAEAARVNVAGGCGQSGGVAMRRTPVCRGRHRDRRVGRAGWVASRAVHE